MTLADAISSATSSDSRKNNIRKPLGLCNPVAMNSAAIDVLAHPGSLETYLTQRTKTKPAQLKFLAKQVRISNQVDN